MTKREAIQAIGGQGAEMDDLALEERHVVRILDKAGAFALEVSDDERAALCRIRGAGGTVYTCTTWPEFQGFQAFADRGLVAISPPRGPGSMYRYVGLTAAGRMSIASISS